MFNAYGKDKKSPITRIEVWLRIEKDTGNKSTELQERPTLQENLIYIWNLYTDIKKGCDGLSFVDLDAYQRITGVIITPWEASIMLEIENLRVSNG